MERSCAPLEIVEEAPREEAGAHVREEEGTRRTNAASEGAKVFTVENHPITTSIFVHPSPIHPNRSDPPMGSNVTKALRL